MRGADLHQIVCDARGARVGSILWESKNAKNWSEAWIAKLKADQRAMNADVAVLVTCNLPKGCSRFALIEGVLVTDLGSPHHATGVRANLAQMVQARSAAIHKEEKLELLYRYLSGIAFRQRVEAMVEGFARMREDLEQERRAAERMWARRVKQIEAVTFNICGMTETCKVSCPHFPRLPGWSYPNRKTKLCRPERNHPADHDIRHSDLLGSPEVMCATRLCGRLVDCYLRRIAMTTASSTLLGRPVWYELMTSDMAAAETFYKNVIGWTAAPFEGSPMPYTAFNRKGGVGVAGLMKTPEGMHFPPFWAMYIAVPNFDDAVAHIKRLGAASSRRSSTFRRSAACRC